MPDETFYSIYPTKSDINLQVKYPVIIKTNKTIVLDIDQTLLCTFSDDALFDSLKIMKDKKLMDIRERAYFLKLYDADGKKGNGTTMTLGGVYRPNLSVFLRFCFAYFDNVVVWSAGEYDYVHAVCKNMFRSLQSPKLIFTLRDCESSRGKPTKPLVKISTLLNIDISKMFILDDKTYTFYPNQKSGILIPGYDPEENSDKTPDGVIKAIREEDKAFEKLQDWLMKPEIIAVDDYRNIDKHGIF